MKNGIRVCVIWTWVGVCARIHEYVFYEYLCVSVWEGGCEWASNVFLTSEQVLADTSQPSPPASLCIQLLVGRWMCKRADMNVCVHKLVCMCVKNVHECMYSTCICGHTQVCVTWVHPWVMWVYRRTCVQAQACVYLPEIPAFHLLLCLLLVFTLSPWHDPRSSQ